MSPPVQRASSCRGRRPALLCAAVLAAATVTGAGGCTTFHERASQARLAYEANQLPAAAAAVEQAIRDDPANAALWKLDQALIALAAGEPQAGEQLLREARDHFDQTDAALRGDAALAYLADDRRRTYAAEDYEQVLIRGFLALSNLMHDGGDAEAYSLQLIEKQEQLIAAGAEPPGENVPAAFPRVALAPYLRGVLREATNLDYDDAQRSYLTVVNWQPAFRAGPADLERTTRGAHSHRGHGVLYVFALTGRGPLKEEAVEVPTSASLLIAGEVVSAVGNQTLPPNIAPVKVPRLVARDSVVQAVSVEIGGQSVGATEPITDVTQLAIAQYQAHYPRIVARAVARRCLKKGLVYGAKEMGGIEKGSLGGLALDLAGVAWEAAESADTRCWTLLPDKIQVLRVELPAGRHRLTLRPLAPRGRALSNAASAEIDIADGRNTYCLASFPDLLPVGRVLTSQP